MSAKDQDHSKSAEKLTSGDLTSMEKIHSWLCKQINPD
jgi:hypothetical protein